MAEATSRLSKATKHRWGNENAHAEQEDAAPSKNRSQGNSGRGRVRRGSSSDAEKEPKKEGSRPRSTSEPDLHAEKRQGKGKGKGKGKSRKLCWDYVETGTCEYGNDCRFEHDVPPVEPDRQGQGGRGSNSTSQNTYSGGTVRLAQADETAYDDQYEDEDEEQELRRLRNENAELRGRWLVLCSSCSNPNPTPNPAQTGRVVRVLRTMAHSRGHRKTVRPTTDPTKTLDKSGGNKEETGSQDH